MYLVYSYCVVWCSMAVVGVVGVVGLAIVVRVGLVGVGEGWA